MMLESKVNLFSVLIFQDLMEIQYPIYRITFVLLLFIQLPQLSSQGQRLEFEKIKEKCEGLDIDDRVRVVVADFIVASPKVRYGEFGSELATMLTNALQEINCFKVLEKMSIAQGREVVKEGNLANDLNHFGWEFGQILAGKELDNARMRSLNYIKRKGKNFQLEVDFKPKGNNKELLKWSFSQMNFLTGDQSKVYLLAQHEGRVGVLGIDETTSQVWMELPFEYEAIEFLTINILKVMRGRKWGLVQTGKNQAGRQFVQPIVHSDIQLLEETLDLSPLVGSFYTQGMSIAYKEGTKSIVNFRGQEVTIPFVIKVLGSEFVSFKFKQYLYNWIKDDLNAIRMILIKGRHGTVVDQIDKVDNFFLKLQFGEFGSSSNFSISPKANGSVVLTYQRRSSLISKQAQGLADNPDIVNYSPEDNFEMLTAQAIVTGDITEFASSGGKTTAMGIGVGGPRVRFGFILKVINPSTREVIWSKSIEVVSKKAGAFSGVSIGNWLKVAGSDKFNKAEADVIERGIIQAMYALSNDREEINFPEVDNSSVTVLKVQGTGFVELKRLMDSLKRENQFKSVVRTSFKQNHGTLVIRHDLTEDEILNIIAEKGAGLAEIIGFEGNVIQVQIVKR